MKTTNPTLSSRVLDQVTRPGAIYGGEPMTIEGAINKTAFLLFLVAVAAAWIWSDVFRTGSIDTAAPWMLGGLVGGLVAAIITVVKKDWAPISAPIYAACEGLAIGGLSAMFELQYHGIVIQAVALTFGTLLCMLVAFRSGVIRVTDKFRLGVVAATGAIALLYLGTFVLSLFHVSVPFVFGGGTAGIVISLIIVGVAALNLVLDFDFMQQAAGAGAPKYVEWYAAFGLMVTLIWLYLELLRLLGNLRRR